MTKEYFETSGSGREQRGSSLSSHYTREQQKSRSSRGRPLVAAPPVHREKPTPPSLVPTETTTKGYFDMLKPSEYGTKEGGSSSWMSYLGFDSPEEAYVKINYV